MHYVNYALSVPYFLFIFTSHLQYKLNFSVFKTSFCDILLSFPIILLRKAESPLRFHFCQISVVEFLQQKFSLKTHRLFSVQTVHNFLPVQSFPYKHFPKSRHRQMTNVILVLMFLWILAVLIFLPEFPAAASHARSPRWVRRSARRWLRYTPRRCGSRCS